MNLNDPRRAYHEIQAPPSLEARIHGLSSAQRERRSYVRHPSMVLLAASLLLVFSVFLSQGSIVAPSPLHAGMARVEKTPVVLMSGYSRGLLTVDAFMALPLEVQSEGPLTLTVTEGFLLQDFDAPLSDALSLASSAPFHWLLPMDLGSPRLTVETPKARYIYTLRLDDANMPQAILLESAKRK